jgi:tetratricopeptide (TPR) repeat protein
MYLSANKGAEALHAYEHASVLEPDKIMPLIGIGDSYHLLGDDTRAKESYIQAMGFDPDSPTAPLALGRLFSSQNKNTEAIEEFKTALRLNPNFLDAKEALIFSYNNAKKYSEAIDLSKQILIADSQNRAIREQYAIALNGQGRYDESSKEYQRILQEEPNNATYWGNYGWMQYQAGKIQDAIKSSISSLALDKSLAYVQYNLGLFYAVLGNQQLAETSYRAGYAIAKPDDTRSAISDIHDALHLHPDSVTLKAALSLLESLMAHH